MIDEERRVEVKSEKHALRAFWNAEEKGSEGFSFTDHCSPFTHLA
jgi:hypothetical protein